MRPIRTLRVALPNKGTLAEPSATMLREAGYAQRTDNRELALLDSENNVEFFYLRPRDIATYIGSGQLDVGITGRDLLLDAGIDATELLSLGFGGSTFRYAAPVGKISSVQELDGLRVATSYPGLVGRHLADRGVSATVIRLDGAVETSVRLGVADAVADVVSTGATLRAAGLELIGDEILTSEALLVQPNGATPAGQDAGDERGITQLVRRLQGVLVARRYVMLVFDCPAEHLDAACALAPGIQSPTVSPLQREGWLAVQAMVLRKETNAIMDELYELGARGILVTGIHACRL